MFEIILLFIAFQRYFFLHLDVSLDVFLSFNKIKEIVSSIEEIQKALESSDMLELSSDRQSVRRVTEIKRKDNIDECTVYVVSKASVKHRYQVICKKK